MTIMLGVAVSAMFANVSSAKSDKKIVPEQMQVVKRGMELNVLSFGASYSEYQGHLKGIVESFGDKLNFTRFHYINSIHEIIAVEERIEQGEIKRVSKAEAMGFKDKKKEAAYAWLRNKRYEHEGPYEMFTLEELISRKWDYIDHTPHSSWANRMPLIELRLVPLLKYIKKKSPDAKFVFPHIAQYRNDELVFKAAMNSSVYERARQGHPYTEDQHFFDALCNTIAVNAKHGVLVAPTGTAVQNARYDKGWRQVAPDSKFDYFHAEAPSKPNVGRKLHCGFRWSKKQRKTSRYKWEIDSHPGGGQSYLNACVWYEVFFKRSCVGSTYVPLDKRGENVFSKEDLATLQRIAHETMKGKLPPLRLSHPESRLKYGNILVKRASELLNSKDEESIAIAANCYHNLVAFIPEHPKVKMAKEYLAKVEQLQAAEKAAAEEVKDRPIRERRYKLIWDASGKTTTVDDKVLGRWDDL